MQRQDVEGPVRSGVGEERLEKPLRRYPVTRAGGAPVRDGEGEEAAEYDRSGRVDLLDRLLAQPQQGQILVRVRLATPLEIEIRLIPNLVGDRRLVGQFRMLRPEASPATVAPDELSQEGLPGHLLHVAVDGWPVWASGDPSRE